MLEAKAAAGMPQQRCMGLSWDMQLVTDSQKITKTA